ncbi:hypothetical protein [Streptococcus sp. NLN64]|uniref:hypothetical protein n=1 Tax=Streptococcus sp. NLN64 TaxID=2822799 RepID=UPI0018C9C4EA|nr:hypothetical protein [Streptococcus sp. NLN64]MBG9367047.1 hypothetical protein [Streptococcus sp. NLN64]
MKKLLFSTAALAALVLGASVVSADVQTGTTEGSTNGRNMYSQNPLNQKSYVSPRDAMDAATMVVDGHAEDIANEAKQTAAVVEAQKALDSAVNAEANHQYAENVATAQAKYDETLEQAKKETRNKYLAQLSQRYIEAAKAQGNFHEESPEQANKPNKMRIEEDYEKNTGKKINLDDRSEASKSTEEAVKSAVEAAKKDAAKAAKAGKKDAAKKDGQKVLPNTSAVK